MEGGSSFKDELYRGALNLGVSLSPEMLDKFLIYAGMLVEWNGKMNLTALTSPKDIVQKHFLDSLTVLRHMQADKAADIGTGAGFPGLPVKIAVPDVEMTLIDSTSKRLKFLDEVIGRLGLRNIQTVHMRAEEAGRGEYRSAFGAVLSRAVARLDLLSELCIPLVKSGGLFIAMKGPNAEEELAGAAECIGKLGGEVISCAGAKLPRPAEGYEDVGRTLIITKKVRQTPPKYPRTSAELARIYKK